jgi:hypothetical protein
MADQTTGLIEACLRAFHGDAWGLLQQQWPEAAVNEQRRKMAEVIRQVQSISDLAAEVRRLSGCLLAIAGAEGCGNGALRTAAYEAVTMGATLSELAFKLKLPTPLRRGAGADEK